MTVAGAVDSCLNQLVLQSFVAVYCLIGLQCWCHCAWPCNTKVTRTLQASVCIGSALSADRLLSHKSAHKCYRCVCVCWVWVGNFKPFTPLHDCPCRALPCPLPCRIMCNSRCRQLSAEPRSQVWRLKHRHICLFSMPATSLAHTHVATLQEEAVWEKRCAKMHAGYWYVSVWWHSACTTVLSQLQYSGASSLQFAWQCLPVHVSSFHKHSSNQVVNAIWRQLQ